MYEEQIARGVALLDVKQPDWLARIDLATLDMSNPYACVAAQAYDVTYWRALRELGLDSHDASTDSADHGLTVVEDMSSYHGSVGDERVAYADLTAEWKLIIAELRGELTSV